jgi:branched-chain amino acid transport system substrate-binding protein
VRNIKILILLSGLILFGCTNNVFQAQSTGIKTKPIENTQASTQYAVPEYQQKQSFFTHSEGIPPTKIAILAPFSGQYKDLGKNIMDAAQLALFSANEPNLILVPLDTKGTSYGAVEAANKAIEEGAKLILGPVFSKSASTIASIAKEHKINVVSFSNDRALADSGVYAIGFLPEQQIRRVVEYAMEQGVTNFAAVLPNDAYGSVAAEELRETIADNKNAKILRTEIFSLAKNGDPQRLDEYVASAYKAVLDSGANSAILIPEGGMQLEQITKLLKDNNFDNKIKLLGNAQWYTPETAKNNLLENAWFAGTPHERKESFERKFESTYGYKPIALAGLAYDGVALASALAKTPGGADFSRSALENKKGFMGVDGIFRFKNNGLTERGLGIITIKNGSFETISPSPKDFVGYKSVEHAKKVKD